jgi:gluconate 2-dehydrogenase gamma chain
MINRRDFFQYSGIVGAAVLVGVAARQYALRNNVGSDTFKIFEAVIGHLFNDSDGYVTSQLNVMGYFKALLADKRIDIEEREYLINGTLWVNESAQEEFERDFLELESSEREALLKKISMLRWGDNWLYKVMGYYFEVVFSDPIYGGNVEGRGWRWLDFHPGFPRPDEVAI